MNGATSEPIHTCTAIVAGSRHATDALLMVLLDPCDETLTEFPGVGLNLMVDDIALHARGAKRYVTQTLAEAVDFITERLERTVGSTVSKGTPWKPGGGKRSL